MMSNKQLLLFAVFISNRKDPLSVQTHDIGRGKSDLVFEAIASTALQIHLVTWGNEIYEGLRLVSTDFRFLSPSGFAKGSKLIKHHPQKPEKYHCSFLSFNLFRRGYGNGFLFSLNMLSI